MTDEPFLIAHKVRGEPTFDIAIKQRCAICQGQPIEAREDGPTIVCDDCEGEGFWWIVATSGHRAHPYWHESLSSFANQDMDGSCNKLDFIPPMPDPWPDHYAVNNPSHKPLASAGHSLLAALGLGRKAAPIKRRI